jgi:transcriptional regulator with XRE-family HTH domain
MCSVDSSAVNDCNMKMGKGARGRLARKLRLLRVAREWSQEDLADASGLHRTYISLLERSMCSATLDNLERLANSFGISLSELFDATDSADTVKRPLAAPIKTSRKRRSRQTC